MKAIYRGGSFIPQELCDLPEGVEVEIFVQGSPMLPATVTDPEERTRLVEVLVQRMQQNTLPPGAPRFTRDELHDRA